MGDIEFWVILSLKIILKSNKKFTIGLYCQGPVHTSENETRVWENETNFTMHVQAPPCSPILSPSFLWCVHKHSSKACWICCISYAQVVKKNEIMGWCVFRVCFSCYYFCNLDIQKKWKDVLTYLLSHF